MEVALISLLGAALFSTIGVLGAAVLGLRRDMSLLRAEFAGFRGSVETRLDHHGERMSALETLLREHLAQHA